MIGRRSFLALLAAACASPVLEQFSPAAVLPAPVWVGVDMATGIAIHFVQRWDVRDARLDWVLLASDRLDELISENR